MHVDRSRSPLATLMLGHGAGGGVEAPDLAALAAGLPRHGISVVRVEQPWRVAGRRVAGPPASLDEALRAVADRMRPRTPLVVGGRSAGARSAVRCARGLGAVGCVCLAFPLQPPRGAARPGSDRAGELRDAGLPTLVVQGERDPFGGPDRMPRGVRPALEVVSVRLADHGFSVPVRAGRAAGTDTGQALATVVDAVRAWVLARVARPGA